MRLTYKSRRWLLTGKASSGRVVLSHARTKIWLVGVWPDQFAIRRHCAVAVPL